MTKRKKNRFLDRAEFNKAISIIYGNTDLDENIMKLLLNTWKTNKNLIIQTANLKVNERTPLQIARISIPLSLYQSVSLLPILIANDDLRGISNFGAAFREARNRGLNTFKWGNSVYTTELAKNSNSTNTSTNQEVSRETPEESIEAFQFNSTPTYNIVTPRVNSFNRRTFNNAINDLYNRYVNWRTEFKRPKLENLPSPQSLESVEVSKNYPNFEETTEYNIVTPSINPFKRKTFNSVFTSIYPNLSNS